MDELIIYKHGYKINYINQADFIQMDNEIFKHGIYNFNCDSNKPVIIDAGANIGIATLYFKREFKFSKIICFECNPFVFSYLSNNMKQNEINDVSLINSALSEEDGYALCYGEIYGNQPNTLGNTIIKNICGTYGMS